MYSTVRMYVYAGFPRSLNVHFSFVTLNLVGSHLKDKIDLNIMKIIYFQKIVLCVFDVPLDVI